MGTIGAFNTVAGVGLKFPQSIVNDTIAVANTEQSTALMADTKKFLFINRSRFPVKLAYTATESGTAYQTIPPYGGCAEEIIDPSALVTLYYQAAMTGGRIEIITWK